MSINRRKEKYITAYSYNGDYSTMKMNKLLLTKPDGSQKLLQKMSSKKRGWTV
jgi:hypothetical protein